MQQELELGGGGCGVRVPRLALRVTARMLGRTLGAVKGASGHRSREGQQHNDDGWVVV
jgi:hypothetical protein